MCIRDSLKGKRDAEIRHVLTPNVNFTYTPNFSTDIEGNFGPEGSIATYSPFDIGIYGKPSNTESGVVSFSLINGIDMKFWDQKDTTELENRKKKKVKLIENFVLKFALKLASWAPLGLLIVSVVTVVSEALYVF